MLHPPPSGLPGRTAARPQGNTEHNVQNAALLGASSAFSKKKPAPDPEKKSREVKTNGALAGATLAAKKPAASRSVSASSTSSSDLSVVRSQFTGSSTPALNSPASALTSSPGWLEVPDPRGLAVPRARSPSNIAATLAAARFSPRPASPSRPAVSNIPSTPTARPVHNLQRAHTTMGEGEGSRKPVLEHKATDDTSIAPTSSLVKLFEQNNQTQISGRSQPPKARKPPPVAPKPTTPNLSKETSIENTRRDEGRAKANTERNSQRGRPPSRDDDPPSRPSTAVKDDPISSPLVLKAKPNLPPPRRATKKVVQDDELTKSPPLKAPLPIPPKRQLHRSTSNVSLPERSTRGSLNLGAPNMYQQKSLRQISPHMTGDSLANAIVGANLASSRNQSPARPNRTSTSTPLPPLPLRKRLSHQHEHNPLNRLRSRSNSPSKSPDRKPVHLRTTLRKDESSSSDEGRGKHGRGRKHRFRKHPNKHHEGDRKRWRDVVTERERKRYEGVWAANKDRYVPTAASPDTQTGDVLDLVVRELWSRSRLPASTLAEIWDLVDRRGEGMLGREEFVVGMWLVDQSLKGRKVPTRVMESVWASVRLPGVKVKKKNFR